MKIEFSTTNAAFGDEYENEAINVAYRAEEVSRILHRIINEIHSGYDHGSIMDSNGNKIGNWEL
jgi:hypothetical protein